MKDDVVLKKALTKIEAQMQTNNIEGFKHGVKNLVKKALKAAEDIHTNWEKGEDRKKLRKKIELLQHDLDYLKRYCEGII